MIPAVNMTKGIETIVNAIEALKEIQITDAATASLAIKNHTGTTIDHETIPAEQQNLHLASRDLMLKGYDLEKDVGSEWARAMKSDASDLVSRPTAKYFAPSQISSMSRVSKSLDSATTAVLLLATSCIPETSRRSMPWKACQMSLAIELAWQSRFVELRRGHAISPAIVVSARLDTGLIRLRTLFLLLQCRMNHYLELENG